MSALPPPSALGDSPYPAMPLPRDPYARPAAASTPSHDPTNGWGAYERQRPVGGGGAAGPGPEAAQQRHPYQPQPQPARTDGYTARGSSAATSSLDSHAPPPSSYETAAPPSSNGHSVDHYERQRPQPPPYLSVDSHQSPLRQGPPSDDSHYPPPSPASPSAPSFSQSASADDYPPQPRPDKGKGREDPYPPPPPQPIAEEQYQPPARRESRRLPRVPHQQQEPFPSNGYPPNGVPSPSPRPSERSQSNSNQSHSSPADQSGRHSSFYLDQTHAGSRYSQASTPPSGSGEYEGGGGGGRAVSGQWDQSWMAGTGIQMSGGSSQEHVTPAALMDQRHLKPGKQAALLSHQKTLELYRMNARKTNDPDLNFELAVFQIEASKSLAPTPENVADPNNDKERDNLVREAMSILKRLADRGHMESQYFLADCYANGFGTVRNRQDFEKAFPLFVLAAKHGHPDAAYRAGTCCENGWGCRRDSAKAIVFYKKAAAALHPGALYRLGTSELRGELGLPKRPKDGVKHLKRSAELATEEFPHALHELALLHETGVENVLFIDLEYAAELLAQAAELGYAPSAFKLGECYEYGKMGCPQDAALSIHYYNIAAQQNHREACFALTAWYLVGSPGVLPQSDTEAYLWAKKAAQQGLAKAEYAVGYFTEVGIGTTQDQRMAQEWFRSAAAHGDKRAIARLKGGPVQALTNDDAGGGGGGGGGAKDKDCVIM